MHTFLIFQTKTFDTMKNVLLSGLFDFGILLCSRLSFTDCVYPFYQNLLEWRNVGELIQRDMINKLKLSWQLKITSNSIWTFKILIIWTVNVVTDLIAYFYVVFWKCNKRNSEFIYSNVTPIERISINVHFSTISTLKRISGTNAQWSNRDRLNSQTS